jgi:hypothetical protein
MRRVSIVTVASPSQQQPRNESEQLLLYAVTSRARLIQPVFERDIAKRASLPGTSVRATCFRIWSWKRRAR